MPGGIAARILAVALGLLSFAAPVRADLKLPPRPPGDGPMRIVRVTSSDPACGSDCPEWISAQGGIMAGTANAFAKVIEDLKGRRLPVLLNSRGGSVRDALEMGLLIRQKGLVVAVARTLIADRPRGTRACPSDARGQAITGGAACASACPLILAGGVERAVGPAALIGVHQITTIIKEAEGVEGLKRTRKIYEQGDTDAVVQRYLEDMGIGDEIMALLRKTPAASIRWLSPYEIQSLGLGTRALDAEAPMLATGANGLNTHTFDGGGNDIHIVQGVSKPQDTLAKATLAYRTGGGALELSIAPFIEPAPPFGWNVRLGDGEPIAVPKAGPATVSRRRLCAADTLEATPVLDESGGPGPKPAVFPMEKMRRWGLEEVCR